MGRGSRAVRPAAPALVAAAFLCAAVPARAGGAATSQANAEAIQQSFRHYTSGARYLAQKNYDKARVSLQKSLDAFPDFPEAHLGLGQIAMAEKNYPLALEEFQIAKQKYSRASEAIYSLRMLRYQESLRQAQEVRDQIREAVWIQQQSRNPSSIDDQRISSLENIAQQLENASPPVRGGDSEPPGELYFQIGNALFNMNRLPEATTAWQTAVLKSPGFPPGYNNLAVALWKQGRAREALSLLEQAEAAKVPVNGYLKADIAKSLAPAGPG